MTAPLRVRASRRLEPSALPAQRIAGASDSRALRWSPRPSTPGSTSKLAHEMTKHERYDQEGEADSETVTVSVGFEWHDLGPVSVTAEGDGYRLPDARTPGVYRIHAWKDDGSIEDDAWYVGQSMTSIDGRLLRHLSEAFDPDTENGKRFNDLVHDPAGQCRLFVATSITLNGVGDLIGISDGHFLSDAELKAMPPEDYRKTQFLMNLIESAGQVTNTSYKGPQGTR